MSVELPAEFTRQPSLGERWEIWLAGLPRLVAGLLDEWTLGPAGPARSGRTAVVLPVIDDQGRQRALKVGYQDNSNRGEIATLQLWGGRGAVRLLRADPHRGALLLEWLDEELVGHWDIEWATATVAGLYAHLHRPAAPQLPDLHRDVQRWLDDLEALGRTIPAPSHLVEQALVAGRRLAAEPGTHVLHGDLHYANVMSRDGAWVAIDPKGHNGDPCFEPAPLLWNRWDDLVATGDIGNALRERFYTIVDTAGLDERRARDWVIVRAMINIGWEVQDARGSALSQAAHDQVTRQVTIAMAMQAVDTAM